ncbi:MAG: choloylglycine hydrolase [Lachnospiraceae bacterium]|nr:choloylglycine hydrolase [Ruminococcus sp.]MCM1274379.1 choloylglycine hydrolase [Lachnospiraceae bacterium]
MCTAVGFTGKDFYFGRTLDYDFSYGDKVTVTPRCYCFDFGEAGKCAEHYAMIGMAHIAEDYPLYYEGINEKGLGMAGLNFVGTARFGKPLDGKINIAPHEFIPFVIGQCRDLGEARELLKKINLVDRAFSDKYPVAELHWMIADKSGALVVESTESGFHVYDDPAWVLTNNPEFPQQMLQLNNYMGLSAKDPQNRFCSSLPLKTYSRGMGAIGLPGDVSSESRFARVAFVRNNSVCGNAENECISQFFHILGAVENVKGCCELADGKYQITRYTSCCNCDKGVYYYTTYENHQITAVDMHHENLNSSRLISYEPLYEEQFKRQN